MAKFSEVFIGGHDRQKVTVFAYADGGTVVFKGGCDNVMDAIFDSFGLVHCHVVFHKHNYEVSSWCTSVSNIRFCYCQHCKNPIENKFTDIRFLSPSSHFEYRCKQINSAEFDYLTRNKLLSIKRPMWHVIDFRSNLLLRPRVISRFRRIPESYIKEFDYIK